MTGGRKRASQDTIAKNNRSKEASLADRNVERGGGGAVGQFLNAPGGGGYKRRQWVGWGLGSVGRASPLHGEGQRFESASLQIIKSIDNGLN